MIVRLMLGGKTSGPGLFLRLGFPLARSLTRSDPVKSPIPSRLARAQATAPVHPATNRWIPTRLPPSPRAAPAPVRAKSGVRGAQELRILGAGGPTEEPAAIAWALGSSRTAGYLTQAPALTDFAEPKPLILGAA
jgi:hypothetical protein